MEVDAQGEQRVPVDWLKHLDGLSAVLHVPIATARGSYEECATRTVGFPTTLLHSLQQLALQHRTDLEVVLLTALEIVLYRYTNDEAFVVALGKRSPSQVYPLPAYVSGTTSCRELLVRVQQSLESGEHANRACTAADLVQLGSHAVALLALSSELPPLETSEVARYADLVLLCELEDETPRCTIVYTPSLCPAWFVEQWFNHLLVVLNELCRDLEQAVGLLSLLTVREQMLLQHTWQGEPRPYPLSKQLHILFEEQVTRTPDEVALHFPVGDTVQHTSYRQLNRQANAVAQVLQQAQVGRGVAVGVHLARSPLAVVALLAILKAGGVYLPLDPVYPVEHLHMILDESEAPIVLTTREMQHKVQELRAQLLFIEDFEQVTATSADNNPDNASTTDDIAIIMYTSGTTGRPKGVQHRQRQVVNRLYWMWEHFPFQAGDVACQRSPLGVMPSMWELLGGLLRGIPTLIVPDVVVKDTSSFVRILAAQRVSYITLVPSLLRQILQCSPEVLARWAESLRVVTIGGEHLTLERYERFRATFPSTCLLNDYGCTEVNTILYHTLDAGACGLTAFPGSRPVANLEVYVLDAARQPVPVGVQGEICVGGVAVSPGYLKRPELNAEKFIAHPFRPWTQERLYCTGDRGYFQPDGTLCLLGRMDHQVKIHGMRIELEGVEAVLSQHPVVREGAVTVRDLDNGARQLVAFVVRRDGQIVQEEELRRFLMEHLPAFMVPSRYSFIDALPRTPGGKLDRRALRTQSLLSPDRQPAARMLSEEHVPEALQTNIQPVPDKNTLTTELCQVLARDILETSVDVIQVEQDFYMLGLDSVLMVEFARKLSERYGFECNVASLYDHGTVNKLAAYIQSELQSRQHPSQSDGVPSEAVPIMEEQYTTTPAVAPVVVHEEPADTTNDIAIVGVSGRFPRAANLSTFWTNLATGLDAVTEVPPERWRIDDYYDPDQQRNMKMITRWGAFLEDVDCFEPLFFSISPAEAKWMDPQQRLCLEESWHALEDAGYTPDRLDPWSVGVFVGAKKGDYAESVRREETTPQGYALLGTDPALVAARISYHLNLHGPCLTVDTACSSSLVAIHLACQSIRAGECTMALAGGVCVVTDPQFLVSTSKLGILSPTGRCRTFDNAADGFVQGEGVAFVVLKALKQARQDGDTIYGVIKASAVNHDGKTNGIGAPAGHVQTRLQTTLFRKSGIDPTRISYLEAHGTGTKIGDPIEVRALTESFRHFTDKKQFCALGSLKSNLGHLTAAAGVAGMVKILLCFKQKQLPPTLHFHTPNEHIDFAESPFFVNTQLRSWDVPPDMTRLAALNSFGLGGTNAHCILEEPPALIRSQQGKQPLYLIPVSARTLPSLRQKLIDLQEWLVREGAYHTLRDVSYTLLTGRKHFPICCVYCARDVADLEAQIASSMQSEELCAPYAQLEVLPPALDPLLDELGRYLVQTLGAGEMGSEDYTQKLRVLADLFARGFRFDEARLFAAETCYRVPLPTYPFLRERYWFCERALPSDMQEPVTEPLMVSAIAHLPASTSPAISLSQPAPQHDAVTHTGLYEQVRQLLADILGFDASILRDEAALDSYGFDSIRAITLKYELEKRLTCEVPIEVIGQCVTLRELVAQLDDLCVQRRAQASDHGQNSQPEELEQLKERFLHGKLTLSALDAVELNTLYTIFADDIERVHR